LLDQFRQLHPGWLALALMAGLSQVVLSAWRWRYTARQLNLTLSGKRAVADYFLSTLVNQVMPGGVLGDVARGVRHGARLSQGEQERRYGVAVRAVMLERLSGQLVLVPVLIGLLLLTSVGQDLLRLAWTAAGWQILSGLVLLAALMILLRATRHLPWPQSLVALAKVMHEEAWRALLRWPVCAWQLVSSCAVIGSYLLLFILAARALGIDTSIWILLPLIPLVLLGMLVPLTVSGWGVRESLAAVLWPLVGLPAEEGVAISVLYGLMVLLSSLPGLFTLLRDALYHSRIRSNKVSRPSSKRLKSGRKASSS
ncbi:MAG: flippase-like domain-containing protein, partial [Natronospirillum sp.]|uniref:lysylphosphatidylglycerol synthase transmembrane domain-containing protein n=1 Tax=Natronospirillum sp. TaxID=2812955 RepID=UPI0025D3A7BA